MLHINGAHGQRQRFLVLAHGDKTRTEVADKVHVEHFVILSVKLCQGSLQQQNPLEEIILKEQPLTSQANRCRSVGFSRNRPQRVLLTARCTAPTGERPPGPNRPEGPS
jgi:hypothetical protein